MVDWREELNTPDRSIFVVLEGFHLWAKITMEMAAVFARRGRIDCHKAFILLANAQCG